jgi:hypothetical protein
LILFNPLTTTDCVPILEFFFDSSRTKIRDVLSERDESQTSPTIHRSETHLKVNALPLTPHHTKFLDYLVESTPSSSSTSTINNNQQEGDNQTQEHTRTSVPPNNTIR